MKEDNLFSSIRTLGAPLLLLLFSSFLQDFTIDGQAVDDVDDVDSDNYEDSFRDILLFATGKRVIPIDRLDF